MKNLFGLCAAVIIFVTSTVHAAESISAEDLAKIDSWGDNRPSIELYVKYKSVFDNPLYQKRAAKAPSFSYGDEAAQIFP